MISDYDLESYTYDLPEKNIAQEPSPERDKSRLLILDCQKNKRHDLYFNDIIDFLNPNDLLVVNNTKVFPARLLGHKDSGGKIELFLLEFPTPSVSQCPDKPFYETQDWQQTLPVSCLLKCSKRPKPDAELIFSDNLYAQVIKSLPTGMASVIIKYKGSLIDLLAHHGQVPLPPYIKRPKGEQPFDRERYQTVYARQYGAVAAPTAGLHFSEKLLTRLKGKKVILADVTLHVGYGTFAPVREKNIRHHRIHAEYVAISKESARLINQTKKNGNAIWTVGTTSARALEFATNETGTVQAVESLCDLYIYPGYKFKMVKNLITNFHLPGSSLLFLVSALAGRKRILDSYRYAIKENYKFYSYGDAMAIIS